jgi:hypothetical protein
MHKVDVVVVQTVGPSIHRGTETALNSLKAFRGCPTALLRKMDVALLRQKQQEELPPLPPLLAQILAETRAKQAAKKTKDLNAANGDEKAEAAEAEDDGEAKVASGPLFLEAPPVGVRVQGTDVPEEFGREIDSESEDEVQPEQPPGPIDPSRCRAHGPGFSGSSAGQTVKLIITARDSAGKRIREGGAHVLVMVEPPTAPGTTEADAIEAEVVDHSDGTYTASYSVPTKGNYQVGGLWTDSCGRLQLQPLDDSRDLLNWTLNHAPLGVCSYTSKSMASRLENRLTPSSSLRRSPCLTLRQQQQPRRRQTAQVQPRPACQACQPCRCPCQCPQSRQAAYR